MTVATGPAGPTTMVDPDAERIAAPVWHNVVFTDGVTGALKYCKIGNIVQVDGRVILPSSTIELERSSAAWFPAGFRPTRDQIRFPIMENSTLSSVGYGRMQIAYDGRVYLYTTETASLGYWVHAMYFAEY